LLLPHLTPTAPPEGAAQPAFIVAKDQARGGISLDLSRTR
jgi:hypothetical protein